MDFFPIPNKQASKGMAGVVKIEVEAGDRRSREASMKTAISQKLIESGEREKLRELLKTRLIECGWRDQLKAHCKEIVKKRGIDHVTVDEIVKEITPKGRAMVPDSVKRELLSRIRTFLANQTNM